MGMLELVEPWSWQPQVPVGLRSDLGEVAWLFSGRYVSSAVSRTATTHVGQLGECAQTTRVDATNGTSLHGPVALTLEDFTAFWYGIFDSAGGLGSGAYAAAFSCDDYLNSSDLTAGRDNFLFGPIHSDVGPFIQLNCGGVGDYRTFSLTAGEPVLLAVTRRGAEGSIFLNGQQVGSAFTVGSGSRKFENLRLGCQRTTNTENNFASAKHALAGVVRHAWDQRTHALVARNPWSIFAPRSLPLSFGASGGSDPVVAPSTVPITASTVAGTQTHNSTVAAAAVATAASTVAGTQVHVGAVAAAVVPTSASTPAGTGVLQGAVAPASVATSASAPAGSQVHNSTVAAATVATTASTLAGTQVHQGAVAAAVVPITASSPAADGSTNGQVAPASVGTSASTPAGTQVHQGSVAAAAVATAASAPAGTQVHQGAVAAAVVPITASTPAADGAINGAVAPASCATVLSTPAGTQIYVGQVAACLVAVQVGDAAPAGGTRLKPSLRRQVVLRALRRQVLYPTLRRAVNCYPE